MTLLERALKTFERIDRADLVEKCWMEILAVMVAAEKKTPYTGDVLVLLEALEALDKKAGEG